MTDFFRKRFTQTEVYRAVYKHTVACPTSVKKALIILRTQRYQISPPLRASKHCQIGCICQTDAVIPHLESFESLKNFYRTWTILYYKSKVISQEKLLVAANNTIIHHKLLDAPQSAIYSLDESFLSALRNFKAID